MEQNFWRAAFSEPFRLANESVLRVDLSRETTGPLCTKGSVLTFDLFARLPQDLLRGMILLFCCAQLRTRSLESSTRTEPVRVSFARGKLSATLVPQASTAPGEGGSSDLARSRCMHFLDVSLVCGDTFSVLALCLSLSSDASLALN